jgi:hypothetical protein
VSTSSGADTASRVNVDHVPPLARPQHVEAAIAAAAAMRERAAGDEWTIELDFEIEQAREVGRAALVALRDACGQIRAAASARRTGSRLLASTGASIVRSGSCRRAATRCRRDRERRTASR